jgi:hypothetical protein
MSNLTASHIHFKIMMLMFVLYENRNLPQSRITVPLFTYCDSDCLLFKIRFQSAIHDEIATHKSGAC